MRQSRSCLSILLLLGLLPGLRPALAESGISPARPVSVVIEDFRYLDTSGEPVDQAAVHEKRLQAFMAALRRDVAAEPRYLLVPSAQNGQTLRIVGGIQKMSTLVQWANVAIIDVGASKVLLDRRYSFRGDNEEAWNHAEGFVSRDIRAALAAATTAPIALAVFDFELEDTSVAATASLAVSDEMHLAEVTSGVREVLKQSGRYRLIDLCRTNADAAKTRNLRDCGGCETVIAQQLGADQSLIGVVRRVSRTEYTIGFQIRDARTGAVVSKGDSGLRMGADYSWKRGAVRLLADRLIKAEPQQ